MGRANSICALAWKSAADHARENEGLYRRLAKDNKYFYTSIACDYHRRVMTHLKTCGHGKFEKINFRQLYFDKIFQNLEDEPYAIRIPTWARELNSKKRQLEVGGGTPSNGGGGNPGPGKGKPKKPKREKGNFVVNEDKKLVNLIPEDITYQQLFHPENRKYVKNTPHPDGSIKCNNWHHRRNCDDKCNFLASHSKILTDDEKEKAKVYVEKLVNKYRAKHQNSSGTPGQ